MKKVVELKKQTGNLEVENKKLMELKETQPDPEGLSKLIKEKTEMSTKIEALIERVNKSESGGYKKSLISTSTANGVSTKAQN